MSEATIGGGRYIRRSPDMNEMEKVAQHAYERMKRDRIEHTVILNYECSLRRRDYDKSWEVRVRDLRTDYNMHFRFNHRHDEYERPRNSDPYSGVAGRQEGQRPRNFEDIDNMSYSQLHDYLKESRHAKEKSSSSRKLSFKESLQAEVDTWLKDIKEMRA